jgi:hypothetical protein
MRKYLKYLLPLVSFVAVLQLTLVPALPAAAQDLTNAGKYLGQTGLSGNTNDNPVNSESSANRIFLFIGNIINVAFGLLGIVFVGLTLYAGFTWMTAQGDSKKVDEAKKMLTQAIIGLVIMVLAYSITGFVMRSISVSTGNAPS